MNALESTASDTPTSASLLHEAAWVAAQRARNDLLVYVHIPFCTSKCAFCDWVAAARQAIRDLQATDFNFDLIVALPGQELDGLTASVKTAINRGVPHISIYPYRPDTRLLAARRPTHANQVAIARVHRRSARSRLLRETLCGDVAGLRGYSAQQRPPDLGRYQLCPLRKSRGLPFSAFRAQPGIRRMLHYYGECGAMFEETTQALRVTPATQNKAFLTPTGGTDEAGLIRKTLERRAT